MSTQTFNIALPTDLIQKVDFLAKKEYRNRSEFIREALRVYIEDKAEWEDIFDYGRKQAKKMGIESEKEVDSIVYKFRHDKKSE